MPTGTVKWFDEKQHYGFIIPDTGGPDVFVHLSQIDSGQPLQEGQQVTYELRDSPKGWIAVRVSKAV